MRYCKNCGMAMEDDDRFCVRCGEPVETDEADELLDESEDWQRERRKRAFLIMVPAVVILAVMGCLLFMLREPSGDANNKGQQENNLASYQENGNAGAQGASAAGPADPSAAEAGQEADAQAQRQAAEERAKKKAQEQAEKQAAEEKAKREAQEEARKQAEEERARKEAEEEARKKAEEEEARRLAEEEEKASRGTDGTYILPESNSRYYSYGELSALDDGTLQMAINEIYARHGRIFTTESIRSYFEGKSWYKGTIDPSAFDGNEGAYFNEYELKNRELMVQIRNERSQPSEPVLEQQVQGR